MVDTERAQRMTQALREAGMAALVCCLPENVLLLSTFWSRTGFVWLVYPVEGSPVLILPDFELRYLDGGWPGEVRTMTLATLGCPDPLQQVAGHLRDLHDHHHLPDGTIGFEGGFDEMATTHISGEVSVLSLRAIEMLRASLPGARLVDATALLYQQRASKTALELERLRQANAVASLGLAAFREGLLSGENGVALAAKVEAAISSQAPGYTGVQLARAWAQVISGSDTCRGYEFCLPSSRQPFREGDLVMLELGTVVDGYWSDLTRTGTVGPPTQQQREVFESLEQVRAITLAGLTAGASSRELDARALQALRAKGHAAHLFHHLGHGVGFRYHEPIPQFRYDQEGHTLQRGMVCTVEPGVYIEGWGGMRIEDDFAVTGGAPECLSPFPRGLSGSD